MLKRRIATIEKRLARLHEPTKEDNRLHFYFGGDPEILECEKRGERVLHFDFGDNG